MHLIHSAKSSSRLPAAFSGSFPSVEDLSILLNGKHSLPSDRT
jgi:hypothetical protein